MPDYSEQYPVIYKLSQQLTTLLTRAYLTSPDPESGAMDLSALKAGLKALGEEESTRLLDGITEHFDKLLMLYSQQNRESYIAHTQTVLAVMDRERPQITKRFRSHAQNAIRAFGAFPLAPDETAADRYRQLQWSAKQSSKFGTQRRANHLLCVRAAMGHLAQVAGYPDVVHMEFAMDSDLAAEATDPDKHWDVGEYRLRPVIEGGEASLVVERKGKRLKAIPKAVRSDPAYDDARELQEQLRSQARRLRSGLLEPLVAEGTPIAAADLAALVQLPAGREMIPALIWRTADPDGGTGVVGLAEPDGADGLLLCDLDGTKTPATGKRPLHAAHPWDLFTAGTLDAWQKAVTDRGIEQPVRQAFRELYLLTPADLEAGTHSTRFAHHRISGPQANRLLANRSWRMERGYDEGTATRRFGDYEARLDFEEMGHYLGEGEATTGTVSFRRGARTIDLADVPPIVLSEAMRDVDLVVSVAALTRIDRATA